MVVAEPGSIHVDDSLEGISAAANSFYKLVAAVHEATKGVQEDMSPEMAVVASSFVDKCVNELVKRCEAKLKALIVKELGFLYRKLADVLPPLVEISGGGKNGKLWSAGCPAGQITEWGMKSGGLLKSLDSARHEKRKAEVVKVSGTGRGGSV